MNNEVANTILDQLGGANRLAMMCGCKDFVGDAKGVWFKVGKGARLGGEMLGKSVTACAVFLDETDTYTVCFYAGRGVHMQEAYKVPGVYADQLRPIFEAQTGMFLTF